MDFSYSSEEEKFRQHVRSWLEANAPDDIHAGQDEDLAPDARWERQKAWHKKLYAGGGSASGGQKNMAVVARRSLNKPFFTKS